jgi:hypothetical protein
VFACCLWSFVSELVAAVDVLSEQTKPQANTHNTPTWHFRHSEHLDLDL